MFFLLFYGSSAWNKDWLIDWLIDSKFPAESVGERIFKIG